MSLAPLSVRGFCRGHLQYLEIYIVHNLVLMPVIVHVLCHSLMTSRLLGVPLDFLNTYPSNGEQFQGFSSSLRWCFQLMCSYSWYYDSGMLIDIYDINDFIWILTMGNKGSWIEKFL